MGHWAERFVDDVAARLQADVDRDRILAALRAVGTQIETLTGQSFGPPKRNTVSIATFGLPFVELPGFLIGTEESPGNFWPIPNPVDRQRATVAQVAEFTPPPTERGMPIGRALQIAGNLMHSAAHSGLLTRDYMLWWLGHSLRPEDRAAFLRSLVDASNHVHVPIATAADGGWWFQITRRLLWVTEAAEEQRLIEPLFPDGNGALRAPLAAVEPLLIVGRITSHPADWVMAVRIWLSVERPVAMATLWRHTADAIHQHGIPVLPLDPESTSEEIQCQLLLLAYWHKYIGADEPEIADAIASAYPKAVGRIARATGAPDRRAAAILFGGLLQPGFDPTMGAAAARRYVNRKATIAIINHRKTSDGGVSPWEALGVSERRYYKLLKRFAPKNGARYEVDASVLKQIRDHLISRDQKTETHAAAMAVLQQRGFSYAAARKWLQRHDYREALTAKPRPRRSSTRSGP